MIKTIDIDKIHIPYPEYILYLQEKIESEKYLIDMKENLKNLPPIEVIDLLDGFYSLSNGNHRVSIYKYLDLNQIRAEVY